MSPFVCTRRNHANAGTGPNTRGAYGAGTAGPRGVAWGGGANQRVAGRGSNAGCAGSPVDANGVPLYFILMLALDQTGSIGIGGAQRGIEIVDTYGPRCVAIGLVSFGDAVVTHFAPTDPATVRAFLEAAVAYGAIFDGGNPFFHDDGGDIAENGVDALAAALAAHAGYSSPLPRLIFFKTDTQGFDHNIAAPATVNAGLQTLAGTWLEFGAAAGGTSYAATFPPTAVVRHSGFPVL